MSNCINCCGNKTKVIGAKWGKCLNKPGSKNICPNHNRVLSHNTLMPNFSNNTRRMNVSNLVRQSSNN